MIKELINTLLIMPFPNSYDYFLRWLTQYGQYIEPEDVHSFLHHIIFNYNSGIPSSLKVRMYGSFLYHLDGLNSTNLYCHRQFRTKSGLSRMYPNHTQSITTIMDDPNLSIQMINWAVNGLLHAREFGGPNHHLGDVEVSTTLDSVIKFLSN